MKWLLVLGAGSDIAKALTRRFAEVGYNLYLAGRNLGELEKDAADMGIRYRIEARAVAFDALNTQSHQTVYDGLDPKPEGAICAVGVLGNPGERLDRDAGLEILNANFTGCVSMLEAVARDFEARGNGFIIGISSVAGDRGRGSICLYSAAKAGMTAYLSGLRNRLYRKNVRVMTVKPGFVRTKMTRGLKFPSPLVTTPEEVARDVFKAWRRRKDVVYTKWFWRWIMKLIVSIPEFLFKRTRF